MKKALIVLLILVLLGGIGRFLFCHFVTNRISDWGGMENPEFSDSTNLSDDFRKDIAAQKTL